jgi:hypothetical protein
MAKEKATSGVALFATGLLLNAKKLRIGSEVTLNVALYGDYGRLHCIDSLNHCDS